MALESGGKTAKTWRFSGFGHEIGVIDLKPPDLHPSKRGVS